VQADQDALLRLDAELGEGAREAVDPLGEIRERIGAATVDIGDLAAATGAQVALDQVDGRVVVARDRDPRRSRRMVGRRDGNWRFSLFQPRLTGRFSSPAMFRDGAPGVKPSYALSCIFVREEAV
jgi:hypothetical protein